jgi:predicted RNA-binding Zn ribbon-like protein
MMQNSIKEERSQAQAMSERREAEIHHLIGGDLCLDFANTLNGHERPAGHEYLHDYRDLVLWARHAGILSAGDYKELLKEAEARPAAAQTAFRNALNLREAIFRIFSALAFERKPSGEDLEQLNRAWQAGQRHAQLLPATKGFRLGWDDEPALERVVRLIAVSAINLLTSGQIKRIQRCAGDGCDWLFVDTSRNHLRRWCSMEECGNRAKMRRRQQRKKLSSSK